MTSDTHGRGEGVAVPFISDPSVPITQLEMDQRTPWIQESARQGAMTAEDQMRLLATIRADRARIAALIHTGDRLHYALEDYAQHDHIAEAREAWRQLRSGTSEKGTPPSNLESGKDR